MSDMSTRETAWSPPPGTSARVLPGATTLARLTEHVGGPDDLVDPAGFGSALGQLPLVEHRWPVEDGGESAVLFPLVASNAATLGAVYSIPLEQAWALLPATERFVPIRVTPRRAAITFFAWEIRRGSLGGYREAGAALPVLLDAPKVPSPGPPSAWRREPAVGLYVFELAVDDPRVAEVGRGLLGLPNALGRSSAQIAARGGRVTFANEGSGRLADLEVRLSRWANQGPVDLSFQTYSLLGGRIVRVRYSAVGEGYRGRRGDASVTFGDHRRAQRLGRLDLSRRPLELRVLARVNWFASAPEDVGSV